ncbi:phospholipase A2-like [Tachyglossus aculeatus]|uniref:phospholipase A2-like n=1 Tax=Tachyglossus aculeatus TaxID=9261 RepID=UPI0018F45B59|nr:phospholipase A2-like [Tachyglossus aculeatus]
MEPRWGQGPLPIPLPLLLLLLLLLPPEPAGGKARPRRSFIELAKAIQCSTDNSPLNYVNYGCYCGLGGSGWPRDKTDWCCHSHDCCYGQAEAKGCHPVLEPYNFMCKDKKVDCDSLEDRCQKMMCRCDSEAVKCWAKVKLNRKYEFFPQHTCGKKQPSCKASKNKRTISNKY